MAAFFMDPNKIWSLLQVRVSLGIFEPCCFYLFILKQQGGKKTAEADFNVTAAPHPDGSVSKMKKGGWLGRRDVKRPEGSVILLRKCLVFERRRRAF